MLHKIAKTLLFSALPLFLLPLNAQAQIAADGTTSTTVTPTDAGVRIDNGERSGGNLFHSFQDFSVQTGTEAHFNNANDVANIFSRVTGSNISDIDGLIRANGTANLFLINPNGIIFGENASLNIGGSFFATTADCILFDDGVAFSASDPTTPLLTSSIPVGANFRDNPGNIINRSVANGVGLSVLEGENIALVGGNVDIDDGGIVFAPGGKIELGGLSEAGTIEIADNGSFNFPENIARGDVSVTDSSIVAVFSGGGGSIGVNAQNFNLTSGGQLIVGIIAETGSADAQTGDIVIDAVENVVIDGTGSDAFTGISNRVYENGSGSSGNIEITTASLSLTNGAGLSTNLSGQGNAGNIIVDAEDTVFLDGQGSITGFFNRVTNTATGNAGNIEIATGSLIISNQASLDATSLGQGNAGDIIVNASDSIAIEGNDPSSSFNTEINVSSETEGNAGNIELNTGSSTLNNGAGLSTSNSANGRAGNITINATDNVSFSNGSIIVVAGAEGGSIQIDAKNLSLTAGSSFLAGINSDSPEAQGGDAQTGDIVIDAVENVALDGTGSDAFTGISNRVYENGSGSSGNIEITTASLSLTNGAGLSTNLSGQGNAGNIIVDAEDTVFLDGQGSITGFFNRVTNTATGNAGNIEIATGSLIISNQASLDATSLGQGNAGDIIVNASDSIAIEGNDPSSFFNTEINVSSETEGNAGNIELNTGSLTLNNGAGLSTSNSANGRAGNITINATENVSFSNGSNIFAAGAEGGSIQIDAKNLSLIAGSSFLAGINSDSPEAQGGDISIELEENFVMDGLGSKEPTSIANINTGIGNLGNITISAKDITFENGGNIGSVLAFSEEEQQNFRVGNIFLNATGDIVFVGENDSFASGIANILPENLSGSIGEINVTAQNLTITNGAEIQSSVNGAADSGDINLDIANSIKVDGFGEFTIENQTGFLPSRISSVVFDSGTGNAGSININTQNLELSRNGAIRSTNAGTGNAGNININAKQISISEQGNLNIIPSNISAENSGEGTGGNIDINTDSLFIGDGGNIDAFASNLFGGEVGNGGDITITATDTVFIEGTGFFYGIANEINEQPSGINANVVNATGNAGDIEIDTAKLIVTDRASISADVVFADVPNFQGDSFGNGGSITLRASDLVEVSGSSLVRAALDEGATGIAGDLTIETKNLTVGDGSQISVTSFGDGNAGNLIIRASDSIELSGVSEELGRAGLFSSALIGSGNGGDLSVFTDKLIIRDGATIAASNFPSIGAIEPGTGQPGNVNIEANSISLEDNARIETATQFTEGEAANINLTIAGDLTLQNNSFISARALENANGGNVTINADDGFILAFPNQNNDIIANAARGRGGAINIDTQAIFGLEERPLSPLTNDINASSQVSGLDGTIDINNPAVDPASGLVNLPTSVGDASDRISQNPCEQGVGSEFLITGRGGFPANPQNNFSSNEVRVDLVQPVTPENQTATVGENNATSTEEPEIVPAQGWVFNDEGKVVLTAYDSTNEGVQRNQQSLTGCSVSQNQVQQNN